MGIKVDEDLPRSMTLLLRERGHDGSTVLEQEMDGLSGVFHTGSPGRLRRNSLFRSRSTACPTVRGHLRVPGCWRLSALEHTETLAGRAREMLPDERQVDALREHRADVGRGFW